MEFKIEMTITYEKTITADNYQEACNLTEESFINNINGIVDYDVKFNGEVKRNNN